MITRAQVVEVARTWLGTPFHHQGRVKGVGIDCVGLTIGIAQELGIVSDEVIASLPTNYQARPDPVLMQRLLCEHMTPVWPPQIGDWIWIAEPHMQPTHVGLKISEVSMIHANGDPKVSLVVEDPLRKGHIRRAKGAFAYPGIIDG